MPSSISRFAFIDFFKAIASQLVVLHHLAFYGPMSDVVDDFAPALFVWLRQDARIAVQIFLVIGGYLAARSLAPSALLQDFSFFSSLKKRYLKLVIPYLLAILLSILCAAAARYLMTDSAIPDSPTFAQLLAHATLLQQVLGVDSLSAGVWYVAIDFQLFALLLALLCLARFTSPTSRILAATLVASVGLVSLFYFNRLADWDNWALYFFAAYSLGVLSFWLGNLPRGAKRFCLTSAMALIVLAALFIDYRSRIAVALLTALALNAMHALGRIDTWPQTTVFAYLGKISYSVFLVHFPIILLVNAVVTRVAPANTLINVIGILLAWAASIASGALFYRLVESRSARWQALLGAPFRRIFA